MLEPFESAGWLFVVSVCLILLPQRRNHSLGSGERRSCVLLAVGKGTAGLSSVNGLPQPAHAAIIECTVRTDYVVFRLATHADRGSSHCSTDFF